jgi:hypothetical protein
MIAAAAEAEYQGRRGAEVGELAPLIEVALNWAWCASRGGPMASGCDRGIQWISADSWRIQSRPSS